jgi:hypothetical protein
LNISEKFVRIKIFRLLQRWCQCCSQLKSSHSCHIKITEGDTNSMHWIKRLSFHSEISLLTDYILGSFRHSKIHCRRRWEVSFMLLQLYPQEKVPSIHTGEEDRKAPEIGCMWWWREKSLPLLGIESWYSPQPVTVITELCQFLMSSFVEIFYSVRYKIMIW